MKTEFTFIDIANWRKYEQVREEGRFNMFDQNDRVLTGLTNEEYTFVMKNYSELKIAARKTMNNELIEQLIKQSGIELHYEPTGKLSYIEEFTRLVELTVDECMNACFTNDDADRIANHFGIIIDDDEESGCPCGADGGTSCGAANCQMINWIEP